MAFVVITESKVCTKCQEVKSLGEFYKNGKASHCKDCHKIHIKSKPEIRRKSHLKRAFGISLSEYNDLFSKQLGCCAICNKHQSEMQQSLNVDHDHLTGRIRALLCNLCNRGLGMFKDTPVFLDNASAYLKRFGK